MKYLCRHLPRKEQTLRQSLRVCELCIAILNIRYDYRTGCDKENKFNDSKIYALLIQLYG
jgi:hypothetical protein